MTKSSTKPQSSGFLDSKDALAEKKAQLAKVVDGKTTLEELAGSIIERRLGWLKENLPVLKKKYKKLPPEEQAYHIIYLEHLNIPAKHSRITRLSPTKIQIDSYNFCPYLEACKELGLETKQICREINHKCFDLLVKEIHPSLTFSRNYQNIRPGNDFCEEYIELLI